MIFKALLLCFTITHAAQEACGECWYPYVNTDTTQRRMSSGLKELNPIVHGVLTVSGYVEKSCSDGWHSFLLMKTDTTTMSLMNIQFLSGSGNTNNIKFLSNDNSIDDKHSFKEGLHLKEGGSFKLQFVVDMIGITKIYLNQAENHSGFSYMKTAVNRVFKKVQTIEVFNTECAVFHYVSVCPMTTKDILCSAHDSYPKKKLVEIGASITLKCSTRTIYTSPRMQSLKWLFKDVDGVEHNKPLTYTYSEESTNLVISTLELDNFSPTDVGSYTCTLYEVLYSFDNQVFELQDVPEIISMISASNQDTFQTLQETFNLTHDTELGWSVRSWGELHNFSLEVHNEDDLPMQLFKPEITSISPDLQYWKYFTFSLATYQDITSLTATFKMSNQTFIELTYIPIKEEVPDETDAHTNGVIPNSLIPLILGSVGVIVIVLNSLFCWMQNRGVEREETLVIAQTEAQTQVDGVEEASGEPQDEMHNVVGEGARN